MRRRKSRVDGKRLPVIGGGAVQVPYELPRHAATVIGERAVCGEKLDMRRIAPSKSSTARRWSFMPCKATPRFTYAAGWSGESRITSLKPAAASAKRRVRRRRAATLKWNVDFNHGSMWSSRDSEIHYRPHPRAHP